MESFNQRFWAGPDIGGKETQDELHEKHRTHLVRMSLESFANTRTWQTDREEANYRKTHAVARRLWKDPRQAIRPQSFALFMKHFEPWRDAVVYVVA